MMMRKSILIMPVLLAPLSAAAEPVPGLAFKGGLNTARLDHEGRRHLAGATGGLAGHVQWHLGERFSLAGQLELLYTPRGTEVNFTGTSYGYLRQHYFDVAATVRPEVRLARWLGIYLLLGAGLNLMSSAEDVTAEGMRRDITHALNRIDVAVRAGLGVTLDLPRHKLGPFRQRGAFLEVCHDHGLIDVDTLDLGFKNRSTSVMVGLTFEWASR